MKPLLAGGAGEPGEPLGEVRAGFGLAYREACHDFTHGQQRSDGGRVFGQHGVGELVDFPALDLAVLELAEAVLELLEVADDLPVRDRVVQRREELQQVAQLLGPLTQVMKGFGSRGGGDRAALRGDPPVRATGGGQGQGGRGGTTPPGKRSPPTWLPRRRGAKPRLPA